jgi:hypothetical protein
MKISENPAQGPPSISVRADGAVWVVWGYAGQWMNPDLSFNGSNFTRLNNAFAPAPGLSDNWYCLLQRDSNYSMSGFGTVHMRKFYRLRDSTLSDSSGVLFNTQSFYDPTEPGDGSSSWENWLQAFNTDSCVWVAFNLIFTGSFGGSLFRGAERGVSVYNFISNTSTSVYSDSYWSINGYNPEENLKKFGMPFVVLSPHRDKTILCLSRKQKYGYDETMYFRTLRLFSENGKTVLNERVLDTIPAGGTDLSDRIVLGGSNDFYLLHRLVPGDSLVADRITMNGTKLQFVFLLPSVRSFPVPWLGGSDTIRQTWNADYEIRNLPDGRFVVIYSSVEADSTTNVYAGLLDESMHWIGQPKRVNSDTAGNQYSPAMEIRGDTVYVAWLDTRSEQTHVYMRCFKADQITGVEEPDAATDFMTLDVAPNPVRTKATIRYQVAARSLQVEGTNQTATSLSVYDMLGRIVLRIPDGDAGPGIHTASLDASGLSNGFYQVVLQAGYRHERRNMVVLK